MKKEYKTPIVLVHTIMINTVLTNTSNINIDSTPGPADAKNGKGSFSLFDDLLYDDSEEY